VTGRSSRAVEPPPSWVTATWQAASLLLGYPDERFFAQVTLLRDVAGRLPSAAGEPLGHFISHVETTPPVDLAAAYVDTFDHRRRCCLYLTYYTYGDTRKRGMALLRFKHAYKAAGMELSDDELPDHLAVVLEFGATGDPTRGHTLLVEHRAGLELLRLALEDAGSPYVEVIRAVCATLPPVKAQDREAVLRLAAEGPPAEEVGLQPFGPPEYMPQTLGARR
jgi:nitrate reductase delta subunit